MWKGGQNNQFHKAGRLWSGLASQMFVNDYITPWVLKSYKYTRNTVQWLYSTHVHVATMPSVRRRQKQKYLNIPLHMHTQLFMACLAS